MILICGVPNVGKTTYSNKFENVVHYDELKGTLKDRYEELNGIVKCGACVIEGVFGEARVRKELVNNSKGKAVCIWIDAPLEVCIEREKNYRKRPIGMVKLHHNNFEPPTLDEGWGEIIIVRNNESISYKRET